MADVETQDPVDPPTRNLFLRILAAAFWFLFIFLMTSGLAGGIVGAMAGTDLNTAGMSASEAYKAGGDSGRTAASEFMTAYGPWINLAGLLIWLGLLIPGFLPGVSKHKKA